MTAEEKVLLHLIRLATGRENDTRLAADVDWQRVYALSIEQNVCSVACDGLLRLDDCGIDEDLRYKWIGQSMVLENRYIAHARAIAHLATAYGKAGLKMMLLKGMGLSLNYPVPQHRAPGDIDIYLFGEWKKGDRLVHDAFGIEVDSGHEHHTTFRFEKQSVENHYDIINTKGTRSARWIEQELKRLAVSAECPVTIGGARVFLPPPDFNAIFLMRHMGQHFAGSEIKVRHVLDWGLFVERYKDSIDWGQVAALWERMGIGQFAGCVRSICQRWFGIECKGLEAMGEADGELVERVMNDILHPEFAEQKPEGLLPVVMFKTRRFFANGWKKGLVYKESVAEHFVTGSLSHLRRFGTITD